MSTEEKAIAEEPASPVDEASSPELDGEALIESQLDELFDSDQAADKTPTTEAASEKAPEKAQALIKFDLLLEQPMLEFMEQLATTPQWVFLQD